jgi:hypothetical protein
MTAISGGPGATAAGAAARNQKSVDERGLVGGMGDF